VTALSKKRGYMIMKDSFEDSEIIKIKGSFFVEIEQVKFFQTLSSTQILLSYSP